MGKVILDEPTQAKLKGLNTELEFCDPAGRTLGRFLPEDLYRELLYAGEKARVSDEEIETDRQQTGGRPLAEIWQRLGQQ